MSWTAASYGEPTVRKRLGGGAVAMVDCSMGFGWRMSPSEVSCVCEIC